MASLLTFNEAKLVETLQRLEAPLRAAFAMACAERLLPAILAAAPDTDRGSPMAITRAAVSQLGEAVAGRPDRAALQHLLDQVMELIPGEEDHVGPWTQATTNAQNAGMVLAYAIRSALTGDPQEAAWAARVAYEALDNFVINTANIDTSKPGGEAMVIAHPLLQSEFHRQQSDISDLLGAVGETVESVTTQVRDRARADSAIFFGA